MAELYDFADDEYFAKLQGVRNELRRTARLGGARARAILAAHRAEGHSEITVTRGDKLDWFVNLDDVRGDRAAAAIEYGRRNEGRSRGTTPGIYALRAAF